MPSDTNGRVASVTIRQVQEFLSSLTPDQLRLLHALASAQGESSKKARVGKIHNAVGNQSWPSALAVGQDAAPLSTYDLASGGWTTSPLNEVPLAGNSLGQGEEEGEEEDADDSVHSGTVADNLATTD